ncbi:MAG TPA: acetylornithine/succinylornithine family transaminase [Candidatus Thermoplasmatota archaeon]|nr:acetylornithine/succinylornithine family transaminase [Candidatus Thermoplasmatota archaeon]
MTSTETMKAVEARRESGVFPKRPVSVVRGEGARLWDAEGREYLDFGASYGVGNVGHAHPKVTRAIAEQAGRLVFVAQTYYNDRRAELLEKLLAVAPRGMDRAFLANSGTEAIEAAIKFARAHTKRAGLVAAKKAFHGRTMGALSLTYKAEYREPFAPLLPGVSHVAFGDEEALKEAVTAETAALFLEPIQGEGGVMVPPPGYLKAARDVCTDRGALLVADEIQTGFARTGRMWAVEHENVTPDILCFAKSVAAGLPMGGILLTDAVATLPVASHGNTFGGNPLACAAASAVLDVIAEEKLAERAERLGARLVRGLSETGSPLVREVRGRGLMVGLELRVKNTPVLNALIQEGVLTLPTGATVIRYLPPLVVDERQVDRAVAATSKALAAASPPGA